MAKRFKSEGEMINLKYRDVEKDLIPIYDYSNVVSALDASGSQNTLNLICEHSHDVAN